MTYCLRSQLTYSIDVDMSSEGSSFLSDEGKLHSICGNGMMPSRGVSIPSEDGCWLEGCNMSSEGGTVFGERLGTSGERHNAFKGRQCI